MNNYDHLISKVFFKNNQLYNKYFKRFFKDPIKYKDKYQNIKEYLSNRYIDSKDIRETLYRIYRNIEIRPICKTCGKELKLQIVNKKNQVFPTYCSILCEMKDPEVMKKHNQSCFKKYGSINNSQKTKQTCLEKYGVKAGFNNGKERKTKLEKYGSETYVNPNKAKETCLKKYGVTSPLCLEKTRINRKSIKSLEKEYNTKRENNTFNTSTPEEQSYELLKEKYPDVVRQYRSYLYPFNCDFYIPSLDLYIECHYSQFHCKHQFDSTNKNYLLYLEELKEKANKSERHKIGKESQYDRIIYVWTDLDIRKFNIPKENNLNYKAFYNINNLAEWLKK